jgi:MFS family permease
LLGADWNFGFLGASAIVLMCHRPEERTRVQSLNDFIVFGAMIAGSFVSGGLLANYGWETVCRIMFPPLLIASLALVATRVSRAATSNVPA